MSAKLSIEASCDASVVFLTGVAHTLDTIPAHTPTKNFPMMFAMFRIALAETGRRPGSTVIVKMAAFAVTQIQPSPEKKPSMITKALRDGQQTFTMRRGLRRADLGDNGGTGHRNKQSLDATKAIVPKSKVSFRECPCAFRLQLQGSLAFYYVSEALQVSRFVIWTRPRFESVLSLNLLWMFAM